MKKEIQGVIYELHKENKTASIVGYAASDIYELNIPDTISHIFSKYLVTNIADGAFQYTDVRKITLPCSIKRIGKNAFYGSHVSYIFRSSPYPIMIEKSAFANCADLVRVELQGVINLVGTCQFLNCRKLEYIDSRHISPRVPKYAFTNCDNLDEFYCADGITVDTEAFTNTKLNNVFIGYNVTINGEIRDVFNTNIIFCHKDSDILDLAYEGYHISIIGDI